MNPSPGFLYYEQHTGQPISTALAEARRSPITKRSASRPSEIVPGAIPAPATTPSSEDTKLAYRQVAGNPIEPSYRSASRRGRSKEGRPGAS